MKSPSYVATPTIRIFPLFYFDWIHNCIRLCNKDDLNIVYIRIHWNLIFRQIVVHNSTVALVDNTFFPEPFPSSKRHRREFGCERLFGLRVQPSRYRAHRPGDMQRFEILVEFDSDEHCRTLLLE